MLIIRLEPAVLGLYWPRDSEFNAPALFPVDAAGRRRSPFLLALPYARRAPPRLEYRAWDGSAPAAVDEHGIPGSAGPVVAPDVVLVPCVGHTRSGYRLGYGGGYFDRWLHERPGVAAIGVDWALGEIGADGFVPEAHDVRLTLIVTEHGVVA